MYERVLQIREMEQGKPHSHPPVHAWMLRPDSALPLPGRDIRANLTPIWIKAGWVSFYLCDLDSALAFFSKA